jgi:hypothetical protein
MTTLLRFKAGVKVPKTTIIAVAFLNAAHVLNVDAQLLVTSGNDGVHMTGSRHYQDRALDFRTKDLPAAVKRQLVAAVLQRLGPDYQAFLEDVGGPNEHLHIEHDPKGSQ